jgi:hypothetical protein
MLALVEGTSERIVADLEKIASEDAPPEDRLRRCLLHRIMSLFDIVNRYPHGSEIITSMLPEIVRRLDRYVHRHGELLAQILDQGQTMGRFKVDDPQSTGQMLAKLFEHLTPPYYRFRSRKSLEHFTNQTIDLIVSGLQNKTTPSELS